MTLFEDVKEFHRKFGITSTTTGNMLEMEDQLFRLNTMLEELHEYLNAIANKDYELALDALVDSVWFTLGTAHKHGFDFDEAWRRVKEANMKKVRAKTTSQSKRGTKLDIVKPPGWEHPDLSDLVKGEPTIEELVGFVSRSGVAYDIGDE